MTININDIYRHLDSWTHIAQKIVTAIVMMFVFFSLFFFIMNVTYNNELLKELFIYYLTIIGLGIALSSSIFSYSSKCNKELKIIESGVRFLHGSISMIISMIFTYTPMLLNTIFELRLQDSTNIIPNIIFVIIFILSSVYAGRSLFNYFMAIIILERNLSNKTMTL